MLWFSPTNIQTLFLFPNTVAFLLSEKGTNLLPMSLLAHPSTVRTNSAYPCAFLKYKLYFIKSNLYFVKSNLYFVKLNLYFDKYNLCFIKYNLYFKDVRGVKVLVTAVRSKRSARMRR